MTYDPKEAVEKLRKWNAMNEPQYSHESKQELEKVGFKLAGLLFNYTQTYYPNNQDLVRFMNQDKKEFFISMVQPRRRLDTAKKRNLFSHNRFRRGSLSPFI